MTTITPETPAPAEFLSVSDRLDAMEGLIREAISAASGRPGRPAEVIAGELRSLRLTGKAMRALWEDGFACALATRVPRQGDPTP